MSAHLYHATPHIYEEQTDRLALDLLAPFVAMGRERSWIQRYFFIRYSDPAPHLRLRLLVDQHHATVVAQALESQSKVYAPHVMIGHGPAELTPQPRGTEDGRLLALRWTPYEPEFSRYGGETAIEVAHHLFEATSDAALALLARLSGKPRAARLGVALTLMVSALHAFLENRAEASFFIVRYAEQYLTTVSKTTERADAFRAAFRAGFSEQASRMAPRVTELWNGLDADADISPLNAMLRAFRLQREHLQGLCLHGMVRYNNRPITTWRDCVSYLLPSYLHMTNNRLGVSIPEEAYLGHLLHWSLPSEANA
jgi:thiopeptide-type bacteriocin biosynthesis protein